MNLKLSIALVCASCSLSAAQAADPVSPVPSAAVTDGTARVPDPRYESAFRGYQPYRQQAMEPWRALNEAVEKAGGHVGILRGTPDTPAATHPAGHAR